jgi:hypothetical protein
MQNTVYDSQTNEFAQSTNMTAVKISADDKKFCQKFGVQCVVTVTTPSAGAFTAANATNIFTKATHGMKTGLKVQVSNSGGALPTGLSAATDYFVIYVSANTFKLASSLVNANAGTAIDISDDGTGTHTVTPTALAGCNVKLQGSLDNSSWSDIGSATNITATGNTFLEKVDPCFDYVRTVYTLTAGQISVVQTTSGKGN